MKNTEEIYQELMKDFQERSGVAPGADCDLSVRMWAAAAQIQALGIQADWVLEQSFPQTAQGVYLDRHGQMRGLSRMEATKAKGVLRFLVATPQLAELRVPEGTVCMTEGAVRYQTLAEAVIPAGEEFGEAEAEAVEGGTSGNTGASTITLLTACPVAVTGVTNPEAFVGGSDQEDDEALRQRILDSYARLPNGANAVWYEETALSHSGVMAASVVGRARGIGTVDVYIAGEDGLPSEELLEEVRADLQQRREIAVDVEVKTPTEKAVDLTAQLQVEAGAVFREVKERAEAAIATYFSGKRLGKSVLVAQLANLLYQVEGVKNYRLLSPEADIQADATVLPTLGTLTVTEMEA